MLWFWYFILYSFLGFLLEVAYARLTHGRPQRKCLLLLPLCPVYGLGACGILLLPAAVRANPALLFCFGALTATAAEYAAALLYERLLGVSFWDYRGLPGNLHGRVCLPFSLAWGLLALPLVYRVHPAAERLAAALPVPLTRALFLLCAADCIATAAALRISGDVACLCWYAHKEK